jgi:hypothetical protein
MYSKGSIAVLSLALAVGACSANVADSTAEGAAEDLEARTSALTAPRPKAYLGGRDVALVWESGPGLRYDVYRNGKLITLAPGAPTSGAPNTFIDRTVVDGLTYVYQVVAIDIATGNRSPFGESATVVFTNQGVPAPNITIDLSKIPSATPGRENLLKDGKNFLETWYPKIVKALTSPVYLPPMDLTLMAHPDGVAPCSGPGAASGWVDKPLPIVHICAGASAGMGLFVHEATHVIQVVRGPTLMSAEESIASWAGNLSIGKPNEHWLPLMSFFDDYEYGAYFYDWIASTYNKPNFVRDLNLAAYRNEYGNGAWLVQYTGLSLGQLWGNMYGAPFTSPGALRNAAGYYAYPVDSALKTWTLLRLRKDPPEPERFFQGPLQGDSGLLRWYKGTCFGENPQHYVAIRDCADGTAATWQYKNGAFMNVGNNRCLQPRGGVSAEGTLLVTEPCNGSAAQHWDSLPL